MLQPFTWQISEILGSLGPLPVHLWLKKSEEILKISIFFNSADLIITS